jgi:hypothetical protein
MKAREQSRRERCYARSVFYDLQPFRTGHGLTLVVLSCRTALQVCRRSTSTTTHHSYDPLHLPTAISSLFRSLRRIELIFSSFFLFGLACFTTGRML